MASIRFRGLQISNAVDHNRLRSLFSKPYGSPPPVEAEWRELYAEDVRFQDPTQQAQGLDGFLKAQNALIQRCDDVYVRAEAIAVAGDTAFVEWEMGLKIKGIEFIYPGVSRLHLNTQGLIDDHRDYFDFVGPTFAPVPVLGGFVRWLYRRFVP